MCWTGNPCSNKSPPAKQLQHWISKFPFLCVLLCFLTASLMAGTQPGDCGQSGLFSFPMHILSHGSYLKITNNCETLESFWSFWNLKPQYCCSVSLHQEDQSLDLVLCSKTERDWGYYNYKQKISFFFSSLSFICWVQMLLVCFSFVCRKG